MTSPSTKSKPLRERLLPQTSIRFFMLLIAASALVMYIYRAALVSDQSWAKIAALLVSTCGGCFLVYAALFMVANLFTASTAPIRNVLESSRAGHEPPTIDSPSSGGET